MRGQAIAHGSHPREQHRRQGGDSVVLAMQGVTKIFRTRTVETTALREVTLEVFSGEFVALTGPSGSGKTTLLNVCGLLETADGGSFSLAGTDVRALSDAGRAHLRNRAIGFVFQNFNLIESLSVFDNVEVPLRYRGTPRGERQNAVERALARVGLESRMKHYPAELSGGQRQRVAIARALVGKPSLVLADEPTGNLDTAMTQGVLELLHEINAEGTTIILATHDLALVEGTHRRMHMVDGVLTEESNARPITERVAVEARG